MRRGTISLLVGMALAAVGSSLDHVSGPSRNPSRGTDLGRQRAVARLEARADQQMPLPDRPMSRQRRRWIERHPRDSRA